MRQKYALVKKEQQRQLLIREYAELDEGRFSLMCEETYPLESIRAATAAGKQGLVRALRTENMYPPKLYLDQIADAVITLLGDGAPSALELFFDDAELLLKERQSAGVRDGVLEDDVC